MSAAQLNRPVFRFAPSPNGRLHLGHAFSALLNSQLASLLHGRFLLRIEDIDQMRCTAALTGQALDDLAWLGLVWEKPVRVQSEHFNDYARVLKSLNDRGLVYPCFCSRRQITEAGSGQDPDGAPIYPGTCRHLPQSDMQTRMNEGEPFSLRLSMKEALADAKDVLSYQRFLLPSFTQETLIAEPSRWGEAILARKDTLTSYHLSVVVDDALQGVTHVVRGADLEAATCLHVLLQKLLGLATPLYHHHALLLEPEGKKLAKSRRSEALVTLRARGVTANQVLQILGNF